MSAKREQRRLTQRRERLSVLRTLCGRDVRPPGAAKPPGFWIARLSRKADGTSLTE
jgi:hypothetical protein